MPLRHARGPSPAGESAPKSSGAGGSHGGLLTGAHHILEPEVHVKIDIEAFVAARESVGDLYLLR